MKHGIGALHIQRNTRTDSSRGSFECISIWAPQQSFELAAGFERVPVDQSEWPGKFWHSNIASDIIIIESSTIVYQDSD